MGSVATPSTYAVLRYRRDLGESSSIGALVTAREGADGYYNRVAGIDGLWRATDSDSFTFQALTSQTRYSVAIAEEFDQSRQQLDDLAYRLGYRHGSRNWFAYLSHADTGVDFRADLGFLPQVGQRKSVAGLERIFWPAEGRQTWWSRAELGGDCDVTTEEDGPELERELEFWFEVQGPQQSSLGGRWTRRSRFFGGVEFEESVRQFNFRISPSGDFSTGIFVRSGDNVDFAGTRPGEQLRIDPWLRLNLGRHLSFRLSHRHDQLNINAGRLFTADLTEARLVYQFNRRSFLRLITQNFDIERDPLLYAEEIDGEQRDLFNQLLFSYKLNPRTVLFVGYSDANQANERLDLTQANRAVFMKIGYAWVL